MASSLFMSRIRGSPLNQSHLNLKLQGIATRDLWDGLKILLVKPRNVTFDFVTFTRKQGKTESLEELHCRLTELVVKRNFKCKACKVGGLEAEITGDLLTANMSYDEVQNYLLPETKSPEEITRSGEKKI